MGRRSRARLRSRTGSGSGGTFALAANTRGTYRLVHSRISQIRGHVRYIRSQVKRYRQQRRGKRLGRM